MSKLKLATESNAETLRLHALMQKRNKDALKAVEEMMKHPLSLEQMREQIRRHHTDADKLEKRSSRTKSR